MDTHKKTFPTILAFVMAGGEGSRLHPLTTYRCKPSVPFNGKHRLVDFVLSNLVNSDIYSIYLLVQYKSQALIEHVRHSWAMGRLFPDHFVTVVPPQMREGPRWFQGTADAVAQNLDLIEARRPDLVAIFGADHVYRMDVRQMVDEHLRRGADVSIATLPVPRDECASYGIVETDDDLWVRDFKEKPASTPAMPGRDTHALASMGNYLFSADVLVEELRRAKGSDQIDFGHHILPALAASRKVLAYDFTTNRIPGLGPDEEPHYWRDVGTIEAYFESHFDALGARPKFRMTNPAWPIYASPDPFDSAQIEAGTITHSMVGSGCVIKRGAPRPRDAAARRDDRDRRAARALHRDGAQQRRPRRAHPARDHRPEQRDPGGRGDRWQPRARPPALPRQRDRHRGGAAGLLPAPGERIGRHRQAGVSVADGVVTTPPAC